VIEQDLLNFIFNSQIKYDLDEESSIYELEDCPYIDQVFHYRDIIKDLIFTDLSNKKLEHKVEITDFIGIYHSSKLIKLTFRIKHDNLEGYLTLDYNNFNYSRYEYEWDDYFK
jgi:hypothetical protein